MGLRGSVVLWSVLSLFKISTVACLFPSMAVERSSSLDRKLCGLGTPLQRPWTAALEQEALRDGLIVFRSLNKCLLGRLPHSCVCLWTITSWAEQAIQLRLYKGQERSSEDWGLDSRFNEGKGMSSIINNNSCQILNKYLCVMNRKMSDGSKKMLAFWVFTNHGYITFVDFHAS